MQAPGWKELRYLFRCANCDTGDFFETDQHRLSMFPQQSALWDSVSGHISADTNIKSAVLYGSAVCQHAIPDAFSDIDLHIIAARPASIYSLDWSRAIHNKDFCLRAIQPATGGVTKLTILFTSGQVDLVIVRETQMRLARWAMRLGLHHKVNFIREALDEMATSMRGGYHFIKGSEFWEDVYARVINEMDGVRLHDSRVCDLADLFLVNLALATKRRSRGELVAAQYWMHRHLTETNFRLLRELRLRQGKSLPSFGLGRRSEEVLSSAELSWIEVSAKLNREELARALLSAFTGFKHLMSELVPSWSVPENFEDVIRPLEASALSSQRVE